MKSLMLKLAILGVVLAVVPPLTAHAISTQSALNKACANLPDLAGCAAGSQGLDTAGKSGTTYLQDFTNIFLYAAGIVSLIFVLVGGFSYITSSGDPSRIKGAKDTLLYAIIGLIITLLALPISGYVIKTVGG